MLQQSCVVEAVVIHLLNAVGLPVCLLGPAAAAAAVVGAVAVAGKLAEALRREVVLEHDLQGSNSNEGDDVAESVKSVCSGKLCSSMWQNTGKAIDLAMLVACPSG